MNVKEFYEAIGVNYENVIRRLQRDYLIEKYLGLILKDNNFKQLENAVASKDHQGVFHAAHTIKGMALNLELTPLAMAASELTEYMRADIDNAEDSIIAEKASKITTEFETIQRLLS